MAGKTHTTTAVMNAILSMRSKINEKVNSSLPPIQSANETKSSNKNNSQEEYHEIEAGRSVDGFKEFSRNSARTGKSLAFSKRNPADENSHTNKQNSTFGQKPEMLKSTNVIRKANELEKSK